MKEICSEWQSMWLGNAVAVMPFQRSSRVAALVVILIAATASRADAQEAGAQAEALFREGRELLASGRIPQACAAFEQSQKLEPATTTLLNLAGCREMNKQYASAWGYFLQAERETRT